MKERLTNAGLLFLITLIIVVTCWYVSVGLYSLGLWPLGALMRVAVWGVALFGAYWVIRHLVESPEARMRKDMERMERMRERGELGP